MKAKILAPDRTQLRDLIESIGGEPGLQRILLAFYSRMERDPMIGFFFTGKPIAHISSKQGEFILLAAGLRTNFEGKGPATAHTGLPPILKGHFDRRLVLLREALLEEGLSAEQIQTWVRFEESFRSMVVSREG
jgi:truncated hemoglobin YjbI